MRVAILGFGSIGRRHAGNLAALGHTDLVVFDPDPAVRAVRGEAPDVRFAETLDDVWLSRPEVVFVTSPPHLHVAQALEAARRGCDVFVEKPLSHKWDGIEELCSEIERRSLVSMVGCNMRFHPGPARIRKLLVEGAIGRVIAARVHTGSYLPEWRPGTDYRRSYSASEAMGGGAILDCIHEIDLALWYFGSGRLVAAASATAETLGIEVEGVAELLIQHASGVLSSVHLNFVQREYRRACEVIGSDGTLSWDFARGRVERSGPGGAETFAQPGDWEPNFMYREEIAHFFECVGRRASTANGVEASLPALRIALAAREAGRKRLAMTVG